MSDKRPDIEAERPDFERNALARGLSVDRNDTGSYLMAVTEYRWRGWKDRARIAAEREREWKRRYDDVVRNYEDYVNGEDVAVTKRVTELETLLKEAHQSVCSLDCPSHWKEGEGMTHCNLCQRITVALGTREDGE